MTTEDIIIHIFYVVDERMKTVKRVPQTPYGSNINLSENDAFKASELLLNYTSVIRHTFE